MALEQLRGLIPPQIEVVPPEVFVMKNGVGINLQERRSISLRSQARPQNHFTRDRGVYGHR